MEVCKYYVLLNQENVQILNNPNRYKAVYINVKSVFLNFKNLIIEKWKYEKNRGKRLYENSGITSKY